MQYSFTDWFFFLVLNIGIPVFDAVPVGQRFLLGLVQAVSVRFAGFQSIPISALAPTFTLILGLTLASQFTASWKK